MPFARNSELPEQVQTAASDSCQTVFREAFNSIEENSDLSESELFQRAWGAMQNTCSRGSGDGTFTRDSEAMSETDTEENDIIESGIAILSEHDPTTVHGVAIGAGDVTVGGSRTKTLWPGSVLKDAADKLSGKPLVRNHPDTTKTEEGIQIGTQPPIESVIGEVTDSKYKEGVGILFEAEVDDEEIAQQIENGRADVSPALFHELGDVDEETGARRAEKIIDFRDLGVVFDGAAPSNEVQPGAATAMMAGALSSAFAPDESGTDAQTDDEAAESAAGETEKDQSMELTDAEKSLVQQARATDDPVVVEGDVEALADKFAQRDDPKIVEAEAYDDLSERVSEVRDVLAEALAEESGLSIETAKSLDFDALMSEFEDGDGDFEADALVQSPEAGQPAMSPNNDSGPGSVEALSSEDQTEVKNLLRRAKLLGDRTPEHSEALREEAAEIVGVDGADDIEMEVL